MSAYVISASFGNDSMAMIQFAKEAKLKNVKVVYCDTGWSAPGWEDRIDIGQRMACDYGFDFVRLSSVGMEELVRIKRGFPGYGAQFCTAHLKGLPFLDWIESQESLKDAVVMIGKRREESIDRANTPEWVESSEYHGGRKVWHPLFAHTEAERNALLIRANVEILPHRSRECSPCVNSNRNDLRELGDFQINRLSRLESDVGQPMFRAEKHGGAKGIEQVIQWAKYSPGQYGKADGDLFMSECGSQFGCGS